MATIGVLTYTLPTGLIINNSFDKVVVTNIPSITPNSNAIVTKIQDIGMISGDVLVMRKKQKLVPLLDSNVPNIQSHPPDKKIKTDHNPSSSTKKTPKLIPQAQAVARRNARERNRVKQVNNGFAALRQRIPDEIAEAFESAGSGRGAAKKLSKVETLRMAVEYIRSLERILEIDGTDPESTSDSSNNPSKTVIKSEPYSSADDELYADYPDSNFDAEENMDFFHDNLPDVTTLHGQQYFRIPGTNTYQLIMHETFENEENVQPLSTNLTQEDLDSQLDYALKTATTTDDVRATPGPPAPISSPETFSNNNITPGLLSPADQLQHHHHHQQQDLLSQLQMHQQQQQHVRLKNEDTSVIYHQQSHLAPNSPPISEGQVFNDVQLYEAANTILKRKPKEEDVILEAAVLSEESMMETIDWWDAHTPQSDDSVAL